MAERNGRGVAAVRTVDLLEGGEPGRTSAYVVAAPRAALVETGGSRSLEQVLAAIREAGLSPADIRYVAVTHVHLDHAGGVGALLPHLPNARVVVHEKGAPHLADPTRLVEGTRLAHGDAWEAHFGPVVPVPEERILVPEDGQAIDLGDGHALECLDTPGHSFHHLAFFERRTRTLFPGDVMGIIYPCLSSPGDPYVLPSTAPSQFDPGLMARSCARLAELPAATVAFSHFGRHEVDLHWLANRVTYVVNEWIRATEELPPGAGRDEIAGALRSWLARDLSALGRTPDGEGRRALEPDVPVDAGGLAAYRAYLARRNHRPGG